MSDGDHRERGGSVIVDAEPRVADAPAAGWALDRLEEAVERAGLGAGRGPVQLRIVVGLAGGAAGALVAAQGSPVPDTEEGFVLAPLGGDPGRIAAVGADGRGLAYALAELADVVALSERPLAALGEIPLTVARPACPVRGIARLFSSEVADKPWFHDRSFWDQYLSELAAQRINRLQLGFGMQYNYSHHVARDNYLYFAYPFLVDVPGFDVRAEHLDDEERDRNLDALRFASTEAKRRGIHFQLGLWNHAYEMIDGPPVRYPIRGLAPEQHARYCAAGLGELLRACPAIDGLTLRVHYEGGIPEPSHVFWRTVMAAVRSVDRPIEIDMHAKGVDDRLVQVAQETGARVVLSPKYCGEHRSLPYLPASIRELERRPGASVGLSQVTSARRFTRYGYGDFLREDRPYGVLFRFWPGTQRLLSFGDPELFAGYGRSATTAGCLGVELCEPLTFWGRADSAPDDSRDPYAEPSLQMGQDGWKKYLYLYRLWGRLLYDPDAEPSSWQRYLRHLYGPAAPDVQRALGAASRVLPLVTTMHGLGASYNGYWPEMYVNMPIADVPRTPEYDHDTAEPGTFGSVSPFDPALFESVDDHAAQLLAGERSGRHTPLEVAGWLEGLAAEAETHLQRASSAVAAPEAATYRRLAIDVQIQAGLARFFAGRNRAGVSYALYQRSGDPGHLSYAVGAYREARQAFARAAEVATGVYRPDVAFGGRDTEHGHWADRLPAIDADIAALVEEAAGAGADGQADPVAPPSGPRPDRLASYHVVPTGFVPGRELGVALRLEGSFDGRVVLHYRHLDQAEEYRHVPMAGDGRVFVGTIPSAYTDSAYPIVYFFTVHAPGGDAWLVPGLDASLCNQPYHLVRQER